MAHRVGAATGGSAPLGSVIERLASLQNLIKRDPESYAEEFRLQVCAQCAVRALIVAALAA